MLPNLSYPELSDCRRLFLRNYEVQINIGVHDFEKKGEQRVLSNVDPVIPLAMCTPEADQLDVVVDYDVRRNTKRARTAHGQNHLQKTPHGDVGRGQRRAPDVLRAARKGRGDCGGAEGVAENPHAV